MTGILAFGSSLVGCSPASTAVSPSMTAMPTLLSPSQTGAFYTGEYRNLFEEYLGKSETEIQAKIDAAWEQLFYGDDASERVSAKLGFRRIGDSDALGHVVNIYARPRGG